MRKHINGLVQDCSISIANALAILKSWIKLLIQIDIQVITSPFPDLTWTLSPQIAHILTQELELLKIILVKICASYQAFSKMTGFWLAGGSAASRLETVFDNSCHETVMDFNIETDFK